MKVLFHFMLLLIFLGGLASYLTQPGIRTGVPVLYWASGSGPVRRDQVNLFHDWLVKNGHVRADGRPVVRLALDAGGRGAFKQMIQGVSGVASDLQYGTMPYMQKAGMLQDITEIALAGGFDPSRTYARCLPDFVVDGRQYGFPSGVYVVNLWVNVETFRKYHLEPPPRFWNYEEFEALGKEFVARANRGRDRHTVFFLDSFFSGLNQRFIRAMHRDSGLDDFNETFTKCTLDDKRYADVLERIHRWTFELRLVPTAADMASFETDANYGGSSWSLFYKGTYGMISSSRGMVYRLRQVPDPPRIAVSYYPHDDFLSVNPVVQPIGIYKLTKHPREAELFFRFLTSREYNEYIVRTANTLPPLPEYTKTEEFMRPREHPNEWGVHVAEVESLENYAIPRPHCPFVPLEPTWTFKRQALEKVIAGIASPKEAVAWAARQINNEMQRTVKESTRLRAQYDELRERQQKIDVHKQEGSPIPETLIKNPFHRYYYDFKGMLTEDEEAAKQAELEKEDGHHHGHGIAHEF